MSLLRGALLVYAGWQLARMFDAHGRANGDAGAAVPPWWDDTMLRAFGADQTMLPPDGMSKPTSDAAGSAAAAHRIPIGWVYAAHALGVDPGQFQLAAADLAAAAKKLGPPTKADPDTLKAWRIQVFQHASAVPLTAGA